MFLFLVRLFMLLAALGSLGLTSLDILRDHLGVDTDSLLRTGGNMALGFVADLSDRWSAFLAGLDGGSTEGAGKGSLSKMDGTAKSGSGDFQGNLLIQIGVTFASLVVLWLVMNIGRRRT